MFKIPSLPLQMKSLARCLGGCIFSCSRGNCIFFFQYTFWYILEYYKFGLYITGWRRRFGLRLPFYLSKRVLLCSRYGFFYYTFTYFVLFGVIENRVTKINFKYFNGNCDCSSCPGWSVLFLYAPANKGLTFWKKYIWGRLSLSSFIFAFSYSFKITGILLRHAIFLLKKMVVWSAKFTILIAWSISCIPLIILSALTKLASTSAAIFYDSMENRRPCRINTWVE